MNRFRQFSGSFKEDHKIVVVIMVNILNIHFLLIIQDGELWAATETPWMLELDKNTLHTLKKQNALDGVGRGLYNIIHSFIHSFVFFVGQKLFDT